MTRAPGRVRVGVGGWIYEPWRNNFYPERWPQSRELEYAAGRLTAIEINSTYYGTQKPASFARWRDATPEGFMFSMKASRHATHRRELATAGESIQRFVGSGIGELGPKLGPIVWQFMPTKRFDPQDFAAFLALLPASVEGLALRHVLDVRHESFKTPEFIELARKHTAAVVFTDSDDYPSLADVTGDLVYARLMRCEAALPTGYPEAALDQWAAAATTWAAGGVPTGLPRVEDRSPAGRPRDVFIYFINGAKERAPAAALALLKRLA